MHYTVPRRNAIISAAQILFSAAERDHFRGANFIFRGGTRSLPRRKFHRPRRNAINPAGHIPNTLHQAAPGAFDPAIGRLATIVDAVHEA